MLLYIYQNPVKAGLCLSTTEYPWSSRKLLGTKSELIDDMVLEEIVSQSEIILNESQMVEDTVFDEPRVGRRLAFSDKTVLEMLRQTSQVQNSTQFQQLSRDEQKTAVVHLRDNKVPIRQIARVSGLGKGVVESWCRK